MSIAIHADVAETKGRFDRLVREWKAIESPSSSAMDLAMHPAYQQIIGMGPIAIPWLPTVALLSNASFRCCKLTRIV